jgi:hypothetical protein
MVRRDKLVLSFDDAARKAFVTGFRSRKAARVRAAERGRAAAVRAASLAARAERRAAAGAGGAGDAATTVEDVPDVLACEAPADPFSARVFGAATVRVTTAYALPAAGEADDDAANEDALRALAARHKARKAAKGGRGAKAPKAQQQKR